MCKCASLAHTYAFNTHNYILHMRKNDTYFCCAYTSNSFCIAHVCCNSFPDPSMLPILPRGAKCSACPTCKEKSTDINFLISWWCIILRIHFYYSLCIVQSHHPCMCTCTAYSLSSRAACSVLSTRYSL